MPKIVDKLGDALEFGKPCILIVDEGVGKTPTVHQIGGKVNSIGQDVDQRRMGALAKEVAYMLCGTLHAKEVPSA